MTPETIVWLTAEIVSSGNFIIYRFILDIIYFPYNPENTFVPKISSKIWISRTKSPQSLASLYHYIFKVNQNLDSWLFKRNNNFQNLYPLYLLLTLLSLEFRPRTWKSYRHFYSFMPTISKKTFQRYGK